MKKRFLNLVGPGNVSDNPLDITAYSYCSSETELKPNMIVWPQNTDQLRRIMLYTSQNHNPVIIRGSGTSLADACIGENTTIILSERMNRIIHLDLKNRIVEVEAGVRIRDLNNMLGKFKMFFPLIPFNPVKTIGGLIALDMITKESQQLGSLRGWVEEVEFIDGTGKYYYTKKKEAVLGREGLTGFITRAKLRIVELPTISIDVFKFTEPSEMLRRVRLLKKDAETYFIEFIDKKTAQELGFENNYVLITAYTSLKGKNKNLFEVRRLLEKLDSVHSLIRSKGYYFLQDPFVSLEKTYDLINWCEKNNVRLHGHAGLGLFYAYFLREDKDLLRTFRTFIRRINGVLGRLVGHGLTNKEFVSPIKKKDLVRLKDEYDYNNILSPGKVINYR